MDFLKPEDILEKKSVKPEELQSFFESMVFEIAGEKIDPERVIALEYVGRKLLGEELFSESLWEVPVNRRKVKCGWHIISEYWRRAEESRNPYEKFYTLRKAGDVSLLMSGLFSVEDLGGLRILDDEYYGHVGKMSYSLSLNFSPRKSKFLVYSLYKNFDWLEWILKGVRDRLGLAERISDAFYIKTKTIYEM